MGKRSRILRVFLGFAAVSMLFAVGMRPMAAEEATETFDWSHWLRHIDGGAAIVAEKKTDGDVRRSWKEIQEITFDYQAAIGRIDRLEQLAAEAENGGSRGEAQEQEILKLYREMVRDSELAATCYGVAHILYSSNIGDETLAERDTRTYMECVTLFDRIGGAIKVLKNSPYRATLKKEPTVKRVGCPAYRQMTGRVKELEEQKTALVKEYVGAAAATARIKRGEVYRELVAVNTELAAVNGYADYLDYAFAEIHDRDYSAAEVDQLFAEIKEAAVPVYNRLNKLRDMIDWQDIAAIDARPETILDTIEPYMGKIDRSLAGAFAGMREYGLLDSGESSGKRGSFSVSLPYFNAAFVLIDPDGNYQDYFTTIHEFGHFNHHYNQTDPVAFTGRSSDVLEIHSNGLEMLFCEYSESMFGEKTGKAIELLQLLGRLEGILYPAMVSEFEMTVYRNPGMTVTEMDRLYGRLRKEYGRCAEGADTREHDWVFASYIYQYPVYDISYVTSGLSALNLYTLAQSDRERAVAAYLEAAACSGREGYRAVVKDCGLADIFAPGTVAELMEGVAAQLPAPEEWPAETGGLAGAGRLFAPGAAFDAGR